MKYIFILVYAIIRTFLCCLIFGICFIITFLWSFKIIKYSDVITNHGIKQSYIGEDARIIYEKVPLEFDKNPIDTFIKCLK